MCKNFNKEGYSCAEVGQILGCCQQTVRNMIDRKQIEALIKEPSNPGGRRVIRITRGALRSYLSAHPDRYSKELLDTFNVTRAAFKQQLRDPVKTVDDLTNIKDQVEGEIVGVIDANRDYIYQNQEWSVCGYHKFKNEDKVDSKTDEDIEADKEVEASAPYPKLYTGRRLSYYYGEEKKPHRCSILVDGRIAVANVTEYTASDIFASLMRDEYMKMHSIEIRFEEV